MSGLANRILPKASDQTLVEALSESDIRISEQNLQLLGRILNNWQHLKAMVCSLREWRKNPDAAVQPDWPAELYAILFDGPSEKKNQILKCESTSPVLMYSAGFIFINNLAAICFAMFFIFAGYLNTDRTAEDAKIFTIMSICAIIACASSTVISITVAFELHRLRTTAYNQ